MPGRSTFRWPDGKRVAVSLSFDDARGSQLATGIPILDRHEVKATFYVSLKRTDTREADWRRVAEHGHEIGNHSLSHACSGNFPWGEKQVLEEYTLAMMEQDLAEAGRQIRDALGVTPLTFAYPCGQTFVGRGADRQSYVPVVARQFLAGRGFRDEHFNDPSFCDLAKLGGTELDGLTFQDLLGVVRKAEKQGAWVVFAGHDVGQSGHQVVHADALDGFCAYCRRPENGVWIDTVAAIAAHVRSAGPPAARVEA